jgi:hypothetical protein
MPEQVDEERPTDRVERFGYVEHFRACRSLAVLCTVRKLSWIARPSINAVSFSLTSWFMYGANRTERHLAKSLLKQWMRLMGRKFFTSYATCRLRSKNM